MPDRDTLSARLEMIRPVAERATEGPLFVHDFADPAISSDPGPEDITLSCDTPATITVAYMGRAITATLNEARANAALLRFGWDLTRDLLANHIVIDTKEESRG